MFLDSELANAGRPLFPGNDVDDQLKRIFRYLFLSVLMKFGLQNLGWIYIGGPNAQFRISIMQNKSKKIPNLFT